ncbi:MAG: hypothetical protein ACI37R_07610 [Candidatus Avigastranaerophilus sp.]
MSKKETENENTVREIVQDIGIDLSITASLVKFLDAGLNEELEVKKADLENLVSVINFSIKNIMEKQDSLEDVLEM